MPGVDLFVLTDQPDRFRGVAETVEVPMRGGVDRLRWQHLAVPRAVAQVDCNVYHDTKNALPRRLRVPAVVTVHDLAYYRVPESFGMWSRAFLKASTRDAVRRARRVVVPSRATANDIASVFPEAEGNVRVVPHGIDEPAPCDDRQVREVLARHGVEPPYVLHVGTVQARKNVDVLVRAMRQLRGEGLPHRVVIAGRRGWLADPAFAEIERDDTAQYLGEVSSDDLRALYRGADAFCSPSAYEGFGFTVADALAAGLPAVVSDRSSLPEVCGDACVRIRELTDSAVAAALRPLLMDESMRQRLSDAGRARARQFSWERSAREHVGVYREALEAVRAAL